MTEAETAYETLKASFIFTWLIAWENCMVVYGCCNSWKPSIQIAGCITEELCQTDYCINRIIDFKEAELQNTFVVKLGVDEELDRCKHRSCNLLHIPCFCRHRTFPIYEQELWTYLIPHRCHLINGGYVPSLADTSIFNWLWSWNIVYMEWIIAKNKEDTAWTKRRLFLSLHYCIFKHTEVTEICWPVSHRPFIPALTLSIMCLL